LSISVSAFIPAYNAANFIAQAIESLLAQTYKPVEIIVADDGSTDNTSQIVASYGNAINYIHFTHQGVYAIRNAMLQQVTGEWFFNLDADNWVEPDFLEQAVKIIEESADHRLAFVYPDQITFGDYVRRTIVPDFSLQGFKMGNYVDMNSLICTETARRFGFDSDFNDGWGDYDFFLTLAKHGYHGVAMRSSQLHYRVHGASITAGTQQYDRRQQLMRRIIDKHNDFFTPGEAKLAIAKFAPEAVIRHRLLELWWSGRYSRAIKLTLKTLLTCPQTFNPMKILASRKTTASKQNQDVARR